ncbi:MAG: hypothetical protein U9N45_00065 [Gemmatimonadota bacterium]|nr:hypothetical protein [Gemmatimonadota bacterium]
MCSVTVSERVVPVLIMALSLATGAAILSGPENLPGSGPQGADTRVPFTIEHADHFFQRKDKQGEGIYILQGSVDVSRGGSRINCGSLTFYSGERYLLCIDSVCLTDSVQQVNADTLYYYVDEAFYRATGDFRWAGRGFTGSGLVGEYYRDEGRMVVEGEAVAEDSLRALKADRLEYDYNIESLRAMGNVEIFDKETGSEASSASGLYRRSNGLVTLSGRPKVTYYEKDDTLFLKPYHLTSDFLYSYGSDSLCATGRVRLRDDSLTVTSDSLFHDKVGEISYFRGGRPEVEHPDYRLTGAWIDVVSHSRRLERIRAVGNARGEFYTAGGEDSGGAQEESGVRAAEGGWIEGDTLDLLFGKDAGLDSIAASSSARSYLNEGAGSGINYLQGSKITIVWEDGKLDRVKVVRGGRGLFLMPDTTDKNTVISDSAGLKATDNSP